MANWFDSIGQSLGNFVTGHGFEDNSQRALLDAQNAKKKRDEQQAAANRQIAQPKAAPQPMTPNSLLTMPSINNPSVPATNPLIQQPTQPTVPKPQPQPQVNNVPAVPTAPVNRPTVQPVVDNRPYPMRVPGTVPTPQQQIQYAPKVPTPNPILADVANTNPITGRPNFAKPTPPTYKGHDLSGLNNDNQTQAMKIIDQARPGVDLRPVIKSIRDAQVATEQSNYDNSVGGKILNFLGGLPGATKQVLVDPVVDTGKWLGQSVAAGANVAMGNKAEAQRLADESRKSFQTSIPGGMFKGLQMVGKPLGATIAGKQLLDEGYNPDYVKALMNQETADVGVNTEQSPLQNAGTIALGAATIPLTIASASGFLSSALTPEATPTAFGDQLFKQWGMDQETGKAFTTVMQNPEATGRANVLRAVAERTTNPQVAAEVQSLAEKAALSESAGRMPVPTATPAVDTSIGLPNNILRTPATPTVSPVATPIIRSMAPIGSDMTSGFIKVGYPNAADLPPDVQNTLQKSTNFSNKTNITDRIANNKLTPRDVGAVVPNNQFSQADIKTLAANIPEFKQNPVMTYNPTGTVPGYNEPRPTFEYKVNGQTMTFDAQNMLPAGSDLSKLHAGEQVDFSPALEKGNNKIPAITESQPGVQLPGPAPQVPEVVKPVPTPKKVKSPFKTIVQNPTPILDETGAPRPVAQPTAATDELNRTKQKALADRKRGLAEVRRIVGPEGAKEVYTITNPNGKVAGVYKPQDSRIGIKGVGALETYRHEAMHKAFAENLTPEQQASVFKAILREHGAGNPDFANMKDSEISALVGNADEKLNYSLSQYIADTNNIKDPALKQYFNDIMAGKYSSRQPQNAKNWSQTGVDSIKPYLIDEGKVSYKEVAPKLATPSEKTSRQVAGQIARNTKAGADYTPNRSVANPTVGNVLMRQFVDRTIPLTEGLKRMDANVGVTDGMGSRIDTMLKERNNVQNRVIDEIKNKPNTAISKFINSMKTENASGAKAKMDGFSEYLKLKSTANDKNAGLEINSQYDNPARLSELEGKYPAEYKAYQAALADIRDQVAPFLTREAKDAMDRNPDYIPMRRDFTDSEKANMFLGKAKVSDSVTARQGVIKSKQGGSQREILNPVDTMISMYTAAKQSALDNEMIAGLADSRYGFKKIGKYTPVPEGTVKMTYFKNGTSHSIAVPQEWAKAMTPRIPRVLTDSKVGIIPVGKILHATTVPIRMAATGVNLAFQFKNPIRDAGSNIIRTNQTARFISSLPKGVATGLTGRGETYAMAKRNGIINNTTFSSELKANSVNALSQVMQSSGPKGVVLDAARHPITTVKKALNVSENIVRLAEFDAQLRAGRAKGLTGQQLEDYAVTQANKHLPDYSKSGTATAIVNEYHPYITAGVAGVRPLARAFKERPAQTISKVGVLIAAATALALAQRHDKKVGDVYKNGITDDEKNHNIVFVMSNKVDKNGVADTAKIPLSPDLYGFNTVGNKIAAAIDGDLTGGDIGNAFSEAINSSTPITVTGGKNENTLYSILQSIAPTIFNAAIQTSFGVNYKGAKQYDTYAPAWAKTVSDMIGKTLTPAQVNQAGVSLLGKFTTPEQVVNVKGAFVGSYTNSGTPRDTKVGDKTIQVYQPDNSSVKRIKASPGDWYEVTAGNDLAKDNGKIVRLDGQSAVYKGSVEGLDKKTVNMLAMTADEVTRDLKSNKYDGQINYLEALKKAEDRDIVTQDSTHSIFGSDLTTAQNIAVAKVNKAGGYDYKFQQLYDKTDLTEWRDLGDPTSDSYDPELYQKLYNYDSQRADVGGSGKSSDSNKNKYSAKSGGGSRAGGASSVPSTKAVTSGSGGSGRFAHQDININIPQAVKPAPQYVIKQRKISVG